MLTFDKVQLLRHMIDVYASDIISPNLEFHVLFYRSLQQISDSKDDAKIKEAYNYIRYLKNHNGLDRCPIVDATRKPKDDMLQSIQYQDVTKLQSLREHIHMDVLKSLEYVYKCLLHRDNIQHMFEVVNMLLETKPKDVFVTSSQSDVCNILFSIMTNVVDGEEHLVKYVKISKELYHYKSSKKHSRNKRIGILYTTLQVVVYRFVDLSHLLKPSKQLDHKSQYLFVICEKDDVTMSEVRRDKKISYVMKQNTPKKFVIVNDSACPKKEAAQIVKI